MPFATPSKDALSVIDADETSDVLSPYFPLYKTLLLTFGRLSRKNDFARFRDVYVGGAKCIGEAIWKDLVGLGNPDVYADVKYDQDVQLLVFPCDASNVEALRDSIVVALDADESYNRQYGIE